MKHTEQERLEFARTHKEEHPKNIISNDLSHGFGCSIGENGFGYVRQEDGTLLRMPHAGNVIIESNVELGSCVCIDRAVKGSTVIGEGTKIDNLVHIAHGAKIGKHCLIVAGAVIGGSAEIGDRCFIGINASIKNKVKIGNNVIVGMGAVVIHDVPDGQTVAGNPAKSLHYFSVKPDRPPPIQVRTGAEE